VGVLPCPGGRPGGRAGLMDGWMDGWMDVIVYVCGQWVSHSTCCCCCCCDMLRQQPCWASSQNVDSAVRVVLMICEARLDPPPWLAPTCCGEATTFPRRPQTSQSA
jgi:hypothetical protein